MAKDTHKVISIDTGTAQKSVADLKKEISSLRDSLVNLEEGTDEYNKVVKKLQSDQDKLDSVMKASKKTVDALPGSYNALVQELAKVKKEWKETNDEAKRNELGKTAAELNAKLKELDSSVGNYQRNVGDYKNAFTSAFVGIFNGSVKASEGIKMIKTSLDSLKANPIVLIAAAFTALYSAIRNNTQAMAGINKGMKSLEPILQVFRNLIGILGETIGRLISTLGTVLKPLLPIIAKLLTPLVTSMRLLGDAFEWVGKQVTKVTTPIINTLLPIMEKARNLFGKIRNEFISGLDYMAKPFKAFINTTISGVEVLVKAMSKIPGIGKKWKGAIDSLEEAKKKVDEFSFSNLDLTEKMDKAYSDLSQTVEDRLAGTYTGLQNKLADLKRQWEETNSEAERISLGTQIQDVEKQIEEMEKSLKGSSESVEILEGSYAALEKELGNLTNAWKNSNDEAQKATLAKQIQETNEKLEEMSAQLQKAKAAMSSESSESGKLEGSYASLAQRMTELKKQWEEAGTEADRQRISKEMLNVDTKMKGLEMSSKSWDNAFTGAIDNISKSIVSLSNPLAIAKKGVSTLSAAFKALIANPVGAFLSAIVGVLKLLKVGFNQSDEASNKLKVAFAALKPVTDAIKGALGAVANVVGNIVSIIPKLVNGVQSAGAKIATVLNKMGLVSDEKLEQIKKNVQQQQNLTKTSQEIAKEEIAIEDDKRKFMAEEAKAESDVAELRAKASDKEKYTEKQRQEFLKQAKNTEESIANEREKFAKREWNLEKKRAEEAKKTGTYNDAAEQALMEAEANYWNVHKETSEKIRSLNKAIKEDTTTTATTTTKTVNEEVDKTLDHLKDTLEQKQSLYQEDTYAYLDLQTQIENADWEIQQKRLKDEKYTNDQIEVYRQAHQKRLDDIQTKKSNLYVEPVEEETVEEESPIGYLKNINSQKIALAQEYSDEWYALQQKQLDLEYEQAAIELDIAGATEEQKYLLKAEYQKKSEDLQAMQHEQEVEKALDMRDSIVDAWGSIGDAMDDALETQKQDGKISDKEYEKRKKKIQAFQIAQIIAESASAIFDIWAGVAKETSTVNNETAAATGMAAAGTKAALDAKTLITAVARTAMIGAQAASSIASVKSGSSSSSSSSSSVSATATPTVTDSYSGVTYTRNVQTYEEEELANNPTKVYVLESDITAAQSSAKVKVAESTF